MTTNSGVFNLPIQSLNVPDQHSVLKSMSPNPLEQVQLTKSTNPKKQQWSFANNSAKRNYQGTFTIDGTYLPNVNYELDDVINSTYYATNNFDGNVQLAINPIDQVPIEHFKNEHFKNANNNISIDKFPNNNFSGKNISSIDISSDQQLKDMQRNLNIIDFNNQYQSLLGNSNVTDKRNNIANCNSVEYMDTRNRTF